MPTHIENTVVTVFKPMKRTKQKKSKPKQKQKQKNTKNPQKLKYQDRDSIFSYFY